MMSPHVVKKRHPDGSFTEYTYAFRGGPRVPLLLTDPGFEEARQAAIARHKENEGRRIAADRLAAAADAVTAGSAPPEVTALASRLVRNARVRSARRRLPCEMTIPAVVETLQRQGMRCAVSGLPFDLAFNLAGVHARNMYAPSLDRLDNRKGYVPSNVRIVLTAVNYAINEWGMDDYLKICRAVVAAFPLPPAADPSP